MGISLIKSENNMKVARWSKAQHYSSFFVKFNNFGK